MLFNMLDVRSTGIRLKILISLMVKQDTSNI